jgi:RND family efflux transporter MFP subunit
MTLSDLTSCRTEALRLGMILCSLLFVAVVAGCGAEAEPPDRSGTAVPVVQGAEVTPRTAPVPIHASGRLASKAEVPLSFKIDGVVDRIRVDEGDRVRAGQELARLHLSEIDAQVQEAESALAQARRDLERTRRLHRDSVATPEELEKARTAVDVAEARLQRARFNRQYAVIEAPADGRILRRRAEDGEYVGPGRPILTLGATGRGWVVRAGLSARDVVRVAQGDTAHVTFDAHPGQTMDARVTEIADAATPRTGTFEVELLVKAPDRALKSGFVGRVTLYPSGGPEAVEIPAAALVSGDGTQGVVYRVAAGTVRRQSVTVARVLDRAVLISSGLNAGDRVVTAGWERVEDGDSVRVGE